MMDNLFSVSLCITAGFIPASPSQGKSMFNPEFNSWSSSIVSCMIIGWCLFSVLFHIGLMIRIRQQDLRLGLGGRSIFPVLTPLFSTVNEVDMQLGTRPVEVSIQFIIYEVLWGFRNDSWLFALVRFRETFGCGKELS